MSSALLLALATIQLNDYVSLMVVTAVGYDYVLTFSKEIEYIWNKPWTWVSTLFVVVRYCGLYSLILPSLVGSTFLPGPAKTCEFSYSLRRASNTTNIHKTVFSKVSLVPIHGSLQGEIINIVYGWTFLLFIGSADFVMILRVWAMYHRSRVVLAVLLIFFSFEVISTLIGVIVYSNPKNLSATTVQILSLSFCIAQPNTIIWTKVSAIVQCASNAAICMFAVARFMRESLRMYGATKQWQSNRFMTLLVKEGILYFFVILLFDIIDIMGIKGEIPMEGWRMVLATILVNVPMYTLTPRFILSIRELFAHDVQGDHASGIDTGFGLSLYGEAGEMEMVFADGREMDDL